MIVYNNSKSVKVLKALGCLSLRLFPGHNNVSKETFSKYFKGNLAAEGVRKECLSLIDETGMESEEKKEAEAAREKNDKLNRAQRVIADNKIELSEKDKIIAELKAKLELLEKKSVKKVVGKERPKTSTKKDKE